MIVYTIRVLESNFFWGGDQPVRPKVRVKNYFLKTGFSYVKSVFFGLKMYYAQK